VSAPGSVWGGATIAEIVPRTARVTSFILAPETPFPFRAGQHVDVRLTAPDGYQARRSYSIASAPETPDAIELAIERLENGEVSPFFHEVAAVEDLIELRGPIGGHFVWSVEDGGPLLLIGAGSGVAPLMAMIRHRTARGSLEPALLILASRTWEDALFRDELIALHDRRDGFDLVLATSRDRPRRPGDHGGRIDAALAVEALDRLPHRPAHVFVCGSNAFVETATNALIAAGVAASIIRTERYGG
jgi:ferredoxin-NADP reductase